VPVGENGIADPSPEQASLHAGGYSFRAALEEDPNYEAEHPSPCEPFKVNQATLTISTIIHDPVHIEPTAELPHLAIVHDTAAISGGVDGFELPAIKFELFDGKKSSFDCSTPGLARTSLGTYSDGEDSIRSSDTTPLPGDTTATDPNEGRMYYAFRAVTEGNGDYKSAVGPCEPFVVKFTADPLPHSEGCSPGYWKTHLESWPGFQRVCARRRSSSTSSRTTSAARTTGSTSR
jgi:hypothetical protein